MLEIAGAELNNVAFQNMFRAGYHDPDSPLRGTAYRLDPDRTWTHLMDAYVGPAAKLQEMRERVAGYGMPLAITECHFSLPGRNRNEVFSSWAAGVANARLMNVYERNGDVLQIATLADFCGTRWNVNAIMIPTPRGQSYMMPVTRVMSLYRRHTGDQAVTVTGMPEGLDLTASRSGDHLFLHVVNTRRTQSASVQLAVQGMVIEPGRVHEIAADPELEIFEDLAGSLGPIQKELGCDARWSFPPASVSTVELVVGATNKIDAHHD
jgi:hypothetical protein